MAPNPATSIVFQQVRAGILMVPLSHFSQPGVARLGASVGIGFAETFTIDQQLGLGGISVNGYSHKLIWPLRTQLGRLNTNQHRLEALAQ